MMYTKYHRWARGAVAVAALMLTACTPETLTSTGPIVEVGGDSIELPSIHMRGTSAATHWNGVARNLVATTGASTPFAIRGYAIVSVAQYNAAVMAERTKHRGQHASVPAAVSAASVAALSYLFPGEAQSLENQLAQFLATGPRGRAASDSMGARVGREVAAQVVAWAKNDRFFDPWTGTVPTGPGRWYSSTPPAGAAFGQARTYVLRSGRQFRPAPPPAFGSRAFKAAVAEVRWFSDNRTPKQDSLAKFWHLPAGTYAPPGYWNEEASKLAVKYRMGERQAAHVLALTNMVMYDGLVASHEAKYHYWLLRPSQADPGITLSVGLPNFPSYPSNHATISAGAAAVLGSAFPSERMRLKRLGEEAAMSRVYGGIHYRFDGDAGIALGRTIADYVMHRDVKGHQPIILK